MRLPTYSAGGTVRIGDHVVGSGYIFKRRIAGVVVSVPEKESGNIGVAFLRPARCTPATPHDRMTASKPTAHAIESDAITVVLASVPLVLCVEYGPPANFELLDHPH